ncbi:MAG: DNA repair protein RecO [Bacteroidaceae bacterium]|nr:DNA repair protein RecO [Bacteroidaceae bacterium]
MLEKTRGIVLHTLRYADQKVIVTMFTERHGAVSFMVRVPRSRKSVVQNVLLSPLSLLEVDFDYQEQARLQRLVDVRVDVPYQSLPYNPMKQTIALFLSEFLYYSLREEQTNPELYAYLEHSLMWLDVRTERFANFPLTFLIRLSRFLGFWPDNEEARRILRQGEEAYVPLILRMDFGTMHLFRFTREQRTRLMEVLNDYYRLHVPHFPELRSMAILREVLS